MKQLNEHFDDTIEQDANEFLLLLIDDLSKSMPDGIKVNFQFQLAENRTCLSCGHVSIKSNSDLSIILPIVDDATTLQQLLISEYGKKETRSIECPNCKHREAEIDNKLETLPRVLIVSINRFSNDSEKLLDCIEIPLALDVTQVAQNPSELANTVYVLKAVIVHIDLRHDLGHYVSYIHRDFKWRRYDDTSVREVRSPENSREWMENAYICFYEIDT